MITVRNPILALALALSPIAPPAPDARGAAQAEAAKPDEAARKREKVLKLIEASGQRETVRRTVDVMLESFEGMPLPEGFIESFRERFDMEEVIGFTVDVHLKHLDRDLRHAGGVFRIAQHQPPVVLVDPAGTHAADPRAATDLLERLTAELTLEGDSDDGPGIARPARGSDGPRLSTRFREDACDGLPIGDGVPIDAAQRDASVSPCVEVVRQEGLGVDLEVPWWTDQASWAGKQRMSERLSNKGRRPTARFSTWCHTPSPSRRRCRAIRAMDRPGPAAVAGNPPVLDVVRVVDGV